MRPCVQSSTMDAPQASQQSLSTRNAWLTYETLPNKRPFMFFNVAMQKALKLLASATSYGILIEVLVDEHKDRVGTTVYHGFDNLRENRRGRAQ